jgi:hypothetical protein
MAIILIPHLQSARVLFSVNFLYDDHVFAVYERGNQGTRHGRVLAGIPPSNNSDRLVKRPFLTEDEDLLPLAKHI